MMNWETGLLAVLMIVAGACSLAEFEGEVTAEADPPVLLIHNETNRTIHYFAGDEDDLALMDLDLSDYSDWPSISAGRTAEIPYHELAYYDEGDTRAWIYWKTGNKSASLKAPLK